jgi:hypothetical protein
MKKSILYLFALAVLFVSCSKEEPVAVTNEEGIQLNNDASSLNQMMVPYNEPLNLTGEKAGLALTLVGEAISPTVNGVKLSASYVFRKYNKVFVTYNERGNGYGGAVRVYSLVDPANPTLVSEMTFAKIDINACDINGLGSSLYLAGSSKSKGGVIVKVAIDAQGIITSTPSTVKVFKIGDGFSANGVIQAHTYLYVSVGNSVGGLYCIDRATMAMVEQDLYSGAKFSCANGRMAGDNHMGLEVNSANDAFLHTYVVHTSDPTQEHIWPIGHIKTQNVEPEFVNYGKHTMFIRPGTTTCYIAMGVSGMKALNIHTGVTVYESPVGMITNGNTNAVSADSDYIYMANGAQGLYIAEKPTAGTVVNIAAIWDDPAHPGSCNMVYSDETHIFVAKGKEGGLKIIKSN